MDKSSTINVEQLLHDCNCLRPNHELVVAALGIADELQQWIDDRAQSAFQTIVVWVTRSTVSIALDPFVLWSSELHSGEDLSFDACLKRYREEVAGLMEPFLSKEKAIEG